MVDDLGAMDDRVLERLPNIRALFLRDGLKFTSAYSETPLCCPGRASFLTGQHTARHGVVVNDARLLDPSNTIATALHDAGYYTLMVGKYLNGVAQLHDHTPPGWDHVVMLNDWSANNSSNWWIDDVPTTAGYYDRFIDEHAPALLADAPADKPVFMWVTPHAPHKSAASSHPWQPDIEPQYVNDARCAGIEPWKPPSYDLPSQPNGYPLDNICRSLLTVDDIVGHLRAAATEQGRNPVWVLMSDNGMAWGSHGYALKNVPWADRLPLYVSGPGVAEGKTKALVSNIDIGPTLADLAGTKMPKADGKSFAAALDGDGGGRKALLEDHPVGGPTGEGDVATGPWWGVRTPRWHLIVWNGIQLYDTDEDPWEMHDVAADHPDVVSQLEGIWNRPIPSPTPSLSPSPSIPLPTVTLSPTPTLAPTQGPTDTPAPTPTMTETGPLPPATASSTPRAPSRSARARPTATARDANGGTTNGDSTGRGGGVSVDLGPALVFGIVALAFALGLMLLGPRLTQSRR
jgi:arylsulfatase A-like enzyme